MPQVRRLGDIADLVEDFVEKAHQEGKHLDELTKRMPPGFRSQEEYQIKRQWAASNPLVQETKENVTEACRRKSKEAQAVNSKTLEKRQARGEFLDSMLHEAV